MKNLPHRPPKRKPRQTPAEAPPVVVHVNRHVRLLVSRDALASLGIEIDLEYALKVIRPANEVSP